MRLRVRSLALLSGLRMQHCRELWCRSQMQLGCCVAVALAQAGSYSSDLTLAWEPPHAVGVVLKKHKDRKNHHLILKDLSFFCSLDILSQHSLSYSVLPHPSADPLFVYFHSLLLPRLLSFTFIMSFQVHRIQLSPSSTLPPFFLPYTS